MFTECSAWDLDMQSCTNVQIWWCIFYVHFSSSKMSCYSRLVHLWLSFIAIKGSCSNTSCFSFIKLQSVDLYRHVLWKPHSPSPWRWGKSYDWRLCVVELAWCESLRGPAPHTVFLCNEAAVAGREANPFRSSGHCQCFHKALTPGFRAATAQPHPQFTDAKSSPPPIYKSGEKEPFCLSP